MSTVQLLYRDNDMVLEVDGLRDKVSGAFKNAATVSATLKDSADMNVTGTTWPQTMNYVTGSDGDYRLTLSKALPLVRDASYTAHITADAGSGLYATWEIPCVCRLRR